MSLDEIEKSIAEFVQEFLSLPEPPGTADRLFDHGLDSLASVELTLTLEDRFGIVFGDNELSFENFGSVDAIAAIVAAQLGGAHL